MKKSKLKIMLFTSPEGLHKGAVKKPNFGVYPLGLAYLASSLRKWADFKFDIRIVDAYTLGLSAEEIERQIISFNPDIVGVSAVTILIYDAQKICEIAKQINPQIVMVIGGPHSTSIPMDVIQDANTDLAVIGEGEFTFIDVCRCVYNGVDWGSIDGIAYLKNGNCVITEARKPIVDLDQVPKPAIDLLSKSENYNPIPLWGRRGKCSAVITSRGCPYDCSYCSVSRAQGRKYRFRSAGNILEELEWLYNEYGITSVSFRDGTFTTVRDRVVQFCKKLINRRLPIRWSCNTRANELDAGLLKLMKKAGCDFIFFGIEQGNEQLIWKHKRIKKQQIIQAVNWAHTAGIDVQGYFMMGMPEEDINTLRETIDFAKSLKLNSAAFTILSPLPSTQIYEYCERNNLLKTKHWNEYDARLNLVWKHPNLSEEELRWWIKQAYREFYLRPSIILDRIRHVRSWNEIKSHIILALQFLK